MKLGRIGVAAAVLSLVLAGCSDEESPGNPLPGTEPPAGGEPTVRVPGNGAPADAPKVANPVQNLEKFLKSPCDMLPKDQAAKLGFDAKIAPDAAYAEGPKCEWRNDSNEHFTIVLLNKQPLGIAGIYRNHKEDPEFYAYFEPVDVAGFPGVFSDTYDERSGGFCGLSVGVTDQQAISVNGTVTEDASADPCDVAKGAAEAAVTTMSKG